MADIKLKQLRATTITVKEFAKKSIIVFDDFYSLNQPNTKKFGSNKIFFKLKDRQKIKLLPLEDKYTKNKQKINIKMFLVKNHS